MKYRKDFVTNSSSSSFICDVCGRDESGMDMGLKDAEMYECENGHTFCDEHLIGHIGKSKEEMIEKIIEYEWNIRNTYNWRTGKYEKSVITEEMLKAQDEEELYDEYFADDERYGVAAECCPICMFQSATDEDIATYFLKKNGMSRNDLLTTWKTEFGNYEALTSWFKS